MKQGAYDYITKPFKVDEIRIVVEKALEKKLLASENRRLRSELRSQVRDRSIVGNSRVMQRVYELIALAASPSWSSTARRFRRTCSNPSCSGT
jgi:DNA-binding NtrC family response regulator